MSFASRMNRTPDAFDPEAGRETRASLPDLSPELGALIEGAAGCSPYLKSLILREAEWLPSALENPEASLAGLCAELPETSPDQMGAALRRAKGKMALVVALADLGGVWSLEDVTGALTRFADVTVSLALRTTLAPELRRGKVPGMSEDDLDTMAGMFVLAMGKMGAGELNYSSDIDLICLFDDSRFDPADYHDARASFVRATRKMAALLNDRTSDGYVFRTDLRLRPDPAVTPVCLAVSAAETYYESLGRTWERAAYIKARPAAGDLDAGAQFLETMRPFVWRRHLDFAAIEDAHNMRLRIREHKGLGGELNLSGHNIKLGRGGIREIEFFTQTRQLISGGRDAHLRVRGTVEGLDRLKESGWIPDDAAKTLQHHYKFHREIEHRLQMLRDAQTQTLPNTDEEWQRLAAFTGRSLKDMQDDLKARLGEVHEVIEGFFAPEEAASQTATPDGLDEEIIAGWPAYPALRSSRALEIFRRLRPDILSRLSRASNPNEALRAFDGFLAGLPAGVQVFSMFEANPQLIDLLVDIAGTSPALSSYLSRHARVFEAVIAGDFFADWPGEETLFAEAQARLDSEDDYERKLDAARRWHKEWHFRIGVHHLRDLSDAQRAGQQYADLAKATLRVVWDVVRAQFEAKHGPAPGRGAAVLGMGSLGAGWLNAGSDLDLIVIYDPKDDDSSDGPRPLAARPYFARLTQALITALTAPMAEGRLYEVDMRLRPSGNQGPVATSWGSFRSYQRDEAWAWEHLALTRAEVIAGPEDLSADIEAFRQDLLQSKGAAEPVLEEITKMRARIAEAKTPEGEWDTKLGAGRLQEIELIAQAGALMNGNPARSVQDGLESGVAIGWLSDADGAALSEAYALCKKIVQVGRLVSDKPLDTDALGKGAKSFLLREAGFEHLGELQAAVAQATSAAADVIDAALSRKPKDETP
ncbi:glutamine-synthetase adenylyltransferase [Roseovarius rhodophyticola]|uniref:Glutamine-synthetase adenylyltransferase n=1 Tax=Roseovarius rhodophyticola TaxID=3080827 RepID=A0ABZ2TDL0_9RHOB|nr:glutamine-synthetase adenylyltransferase [Roseovarius sp. W115]MDV2928003.1 glutamine-synthetase adenylyltransferase [Roseovarius sp. W115]